MKFPAKGTGKRGFDSSKPPILVWTPGKTGQSAVQDMLIAAGAPNVMSIHTLGVQTRQDGMRAPSPRDRQKRKDAIVKYFESHDDIKILTITRDVMKRNISSLFYNGWVARKRDPFIKGFNHDWYLDWFDTEVLRHTGVDVFKHSFDKEAGYGLIKEGKFSIAILKNERMFEGLKAISEEWGFSVTQQKRTNTQDDKKAYHRFCREEKFPKDFIDRLYSHKTMTHFYSEKEIESLKKHWIKQ